MTHFGHKWKLDIVLLQEQPEDYSNVLGSDVNVYQIP